MSVNVSYKGSSLVSFEEGTKTLTTSGTWLEDDITITSGDTRPIAPQNDVNLYDYDGRRLYSYTKADFLALTAYPSAPTHTGLLSTGWNWDLADAKTYVTAYGGINVGHTYITNDNNTRLYINIQSDRYKTISLRYYQSAANGVEVDWGDGSSTSTQSSSGAKTVNHTYANFGKYIITLKRLSGNYCLGGNSGNVYVFNNTAAQQILSKVEIGDTNRTAAPDFASSYCFRHANNLETITIPNKYTYYTSYIFGNASKLKCAIVPKGASSVTTNYVAQNQYCMDCIIVPANCSRTCNNSSNAYTSQLYTFYIPSAVTTIVSNAFYPTNHLEKLIVPSGVTSIGSTAVSVGFLYELWMYPESPPTLAATSFQGTVLSNLVIYVPKGKLATYQGATNWSTYADNMVEMS